MPYSADAPPPQIEALPKAAQAIWIAAFNSSFRAFEGTDAEKEEVAFAVAWAAVKKKYEQVADGKWVEKSAFISGNRSEVAKRVEMGAENLLQSTHFAPINHARLTKAVADPALASKRIAFAEVLVPWTVDTQGDIATDDEVENAAHRFMENPMVGIMHEEWGDIGTVVENFISRDGDPDFEMPGTWVMGIKFNEFAWHKILNNELTGLSIGGEQVVSFVKSFRRNPPANPKKWVIRGDGEMVP